MDLLLSHGYFLQEDSHEQGVMKPYPPLGLLYISSYLKCRGFQVQVFDSTFSSREHFRMLIQDERPPVVGLYCNLMTRSSVLDLIAVCREAGSRVILGGPEPANYAAEYLDRGADLVVIGEGEEALEELLPALGRPDPNLRSIPGIVFPGDDGEIVKTPPRSHIQDLDSLPFPDREAIDLDRYLSLWREHHGHEAVSLVTSRGCPYTCTWCSHSVFGYSYRSRSPKSVADEVQLILDRYDPDMLWYADDVFTLNHRWLQEYAAELRRRQICVPFEAISREDRLNEKIIDLLAEMACFRLWIGAESGSQRILDAMQRKTNARRVIEMVRLLQARGIEAGLFIMLGYEGEQIEDIKETVRLLKEAMPDQYLTTVAYPIKGTPYYESLSDRIATVTPWDRSSDRDLRIAGRQSSRFYAAANRWLVGEMQYQRLSRSAHWDFPALGKALLNRELGRIGMLVTRHQREGPTLR